MRLIDADAIPYTMLYKENWLKGTGVEKPGVWKDTIDAMPTIEARKKGRWIYYPKASGSVTSTAVHLYPVCSECGCEHPIANYCSNCGADMREGAKQE